MKLSPFVLLEYIRSSFETLMGVKGVSSASRSCASASGNGDDPAGSYEELVQELEKEAREHIRIEQQLRLYIETLQNKLKEVEERNKMLDKKVAYFEEKHKLSMLAIKELKKKVEDRSATKQVSVEDSHFSNAHHIKRIGELVKKVLFFVSISLIECCNEKTERA
eukprot:TRINITY_DN2209_c0_g5_i1.p1 TRINITY_DN2209_c0_g5~~TRINITY_DN2209_c0_g5_i1.p1  ORF type:complete len:165 (-),score=42.22 TRINITY_DN2209_c0_g5_i1:509-1003(-)